MPRYAAKLLFQYRVEVNGRFGKRRLCEERIINFTARSSRDAMRFAKRRGQGGEYSYTNSQGNLVAVDFVGIMDLIKLGREADADVVWYEMVERVLPMERSGKIIPMDDVLLRRLSAR
jgi:hypothetical protein